MYYYLFTNQCSSKGQLIKRQLFIGQTCDDDRCVLSVLIILLLLRITIYCHLGVSQHYGWRNICYRDLCPGNKTYENLSIQISLHCVTHDYFASGSTDSTSEHLFFPFRHPSPSWKSIYVSSVNALNRPVTVE